MYWKVEGKIGSAAQEINDCPLERIRIWQSRILHFVTKEYFDGEICAAGTVYILAVLYTSQISQELKHLIYVQ